MSRELFARRLEQKLRSKNLTAFRELLGKHSQVKVFVVGGAVRDAMLGRKVDELDLVVAGMSVSALKKFLSKRGVVKEVGRTFSVMKFRSDNAGASIDVAIPRQDKPTGRGGRRDVKVVGDPALPIEKDLARRDFTINAMAYDIATGQLSDPYKGAADLSRRIVRTVGKPEERFREDYTRMLRGIRFAAQLDLSLHSNTTQAIKKLAKKINSHKNSRRLVPWELIGREFILAFAVQPLVTLELLDQTHLLKEILPELDQLKVIVQEKKFHPEGDVWAHTKLMLKKLHPDKQETSLTLLLSALFHDLGKATNVQLRNRKTNKLKTLKDPVNFLNTNSIDQKKFRIMNIGHAKSSEALARLIIKRLRLEQFAGQTITYFEPREVLYNVRHHLLENIGEMSATKAEKILFRTDGSVRKDLIALAKADSMNKDTRRFRQANKRVTEITKGNSNAPVPLLTGSDLVALGLRPSPQFSKIFADIRGLQLAGKLKTKREAVALIKSKTNKKEGTRKKP